jgi:predicted SAM-dependent methyltransferase
MAPDLALAQFNENDLIHPTMDNSITSYVQYGCAYSAPEKWTNFDCSPTLRYEQLPVVGKLYTRNAQRFPTNVLFGDVLKGLPIASGSCAGVYASHVLEHLSLQDMRFALKETLRILRPGGRYRLIVPDLETLIEEYRASKEPEAALTFMRDSLLGHEERSRGLGGLLKTQMGNSAHMWMWDYKSMAAELQDAGFTSIRRCAFNDSEDPMFKLVEDPNRFVRALAIEAMRPA